MPIRFVHIHQVDPVLLSLARRIAVALERIAADDVSDADVEALRQFSGALRGQQEELASTVNQGASPQSKE